MNWDGCAYLMIDDAEELQVKSHQEGVRWMGSPL